MTQITTERLEEILAALPPTADEVAALFMDLGIKGTPGTAGCCPVSNYVANELGITTSEYGATYAGTPGVTFYRYAFARGTTDEFVFTTAPEHLTRFARRFDDGAYPALVEDDSVA